MDYSAPKTAKMYRIVFLWCSSVLLAACTLRQDKTISTLPYYNTPDFTPHFIDNPEEVAAQITHTIAPFNFLNHDSVAITPDIFRDQIHVANFIFTSCGSICPTMTRNMKLLSDSLGNRPVVLLSYTVTPWIDKPHVLRRYRDDNGIHNPRWHFVTGNKAALYNLARQSYFAEEDLGFTKDSTEFLHTEHVILVDKNKRIRGVYNGTLPLDMLHLLEDINTLAAEQ